MKTLKATKPAEAEIDLPLPFHFVTCGSTSAPVYHRLSESNGMITETSVCPAGKRYSWQDYNPDLLNIYTYRLPSDYEPIPAADYAQQLSRIMDQLVKEADELNKEQEGGK